MGQFLHASNPDLKNLPVTVWVQGDIWGEIPSRHVPDTLAPPYIVVEYFNPGKGMYQHADISMPLYIGMNKSTYFQRCIISVVITWSFMDPYFWKNIYNFNRYPYMICNIHPSAHFSTLSPFFDSARSFFVKPIRGNVNILPKHQKMQTWQWRTSLLLVE